MRRFVFSMALTAGVLAVAAMPLPARADIVNGSFEDPVVGAGSFSLFNTGADVGGWTVVGPQVAITSGDFTQSGISFVAQSGAQWLDLTGFNANSSEGVEQTVGTTAGDSYSLSFWVGNVSGSLFGSSSTVNVLINDSLKLAATNSDGTTVQNWKEFTLPFTAAGTSTKITFLNADPAGDNSNGLDNVHVARSGGPPPAVPLPAAAPAAMALVAMILAGKVLRTRILA